MTYIEWLEKNKFEKSSVVSKGGLETWFRPTVFGAPKCRSKTNEVKPVEISVTRDPSIAKEGEKGIFSMSVMGDNGKYWMTCNAFYLDEDTLIKKGRDIEMRLVDSWRGFN